MLISSTLDQILFCLLFTTVHTRMYIVPSIRISTALSTKFYLFYSTKSENICKVTLVEETHRNKRSLTEFNDFFNDTKCPFTRPKFRPSASINLTNDTNVIDETPESILLDDEPTRDLTPSEPRDELITSKRDLTVTQTHLQPRKKIDLSPVEAEEEKPEEISDWQIIYEPLGKNIMILHLRYIKPVESSVKAVYEIKCSDGSSPHITNNVIIINLEPYVNVTRDNDDVNGVSYYLENPPCSCDVMPNSCDFNCCCDQNCSIDALKFFGCSEPFVKKGNDLRQPTGFECDSTSKSFLCVNFATTSFIDWFYRPERILKTVKEFDERVSGSRNMDFLLKPPSFHWTTSHYVQGSAIQIKLLEENDAIGVWTLPKSHFGDECVRTSPVFFQTNQKSRCAMRVGKHDCAQNGILNFNSHSPSQNYEFLSELFGNEAAPIKLTVECAILPNCVTSFNDTVCLNPVMEASYVFHWRGPKIESIDIFLLTIPSVRISELVKQTFSVEFVHKAEESRKISKEREESNTSELPSFKSDADGVCLDDFSFVSVGESTLTSCLLHVDEGSSESCADYREFLCGRFRGLWGTVEKSVGKSRGLILNTNFTLCDSSSRVYNTCFEMPTKIWIEVIFADLAEMNVRSDFNILGIRMNLEPTPCIPPVGFGFEKINSSLSKKNGDDDLFTVVCEPQKEVIIQSIIKSELLPPEQYHYMLELFTDQLSIFHFLLPRKLLNELFYLFSTESTSSLTQTLAVTMFSIFVVINGMILLLNMRK